MVRHRLVIRLLVLNILLRRTVVVVELCGALLSAVHLLILIVVENKEFDEFEFQFVVGALFDEVDLDVHSPVSVSTAVRVILVAVKMIVLRDHPRIQQRLETFEFELRSVVQLLKIYLGEKVVDCYLARTVSLLNVVARQPQ